MIILYGIKNCDTVKRARKWLEAEGISHEFHDFRKDGLDAALVAEFIKALGHAALINKRGTTWRKLDEGDKTDISEAKAAALMLAHAALIKRPVWRLADGWALGFSAADQAALALKLGK